MSLIGLTVNIFFGLNALAGAFVCGACGLWILRNF
jgi:hypothetical protein